MANIAQKTHAPGRKEMLMKNEYLASALVPTVTVLNAGISEETPAPRRDSFSIV